MRGVSAARTVSRGDAEGVEVDVAEHRPRAEHERRLGRRVEREGRHHDLVARADPERAQRDRQRVGAVRHAHAVPHAEVARELLLEGLHLGPEDVAPAAGDAVERLAEAVVVGLETAGEKRDGQGSLPYFALPLIASLTDPIVEVAVDVVDAMGLPGVFVLMLLESACIPVPSEATMLFAGFNVSRGEYSLFAATAVGSVANLVGSWIAYWIGRAGRVDILEKHGKKLHIKKSHLEWADRWFERHGDATVFFTRMLPIIRTFISLPAGVARMPFWRFTVLTLLGCVPWVLMLTFIGKEAGDNWEKWKDSLHYVDYAVAAAIVIGVVWLFVRNRRRPAPRGPKPYGTLAKRAERPYCGSAGGLTMSPPAHPPRPASRPHRQRPGGSARSRASCTHVRAVLPVSAVAFVTPTPTADDGSPIGWFADEDLRVAIEASLSRLVRSRPLLLPRVEAWQAAPELMEAISAELGQERAQRVWEALSRSVA